MPDKTTIRGQDGTEAEMDRVKQLRNDVVRLDVELLAEDGGQRCRVDMTVSTSDFDLVTSWRDGDLADLGDPDWLEDVLGEHRQTAA